MAKILIIDDDEAVRIVYRAYLSKAGHTVESAKDGPEGLHRTATFAPDLVLVDINMPRLSGFEVVRQLKEDPATKDIPVFIITSLKQAHHVKRAAAMGAAGYITKPTRAPELAAIINKALRLPDQPRA
ncbi:MAG TPA: response regulator [Elusimicrobiales bacterium]|nr:response regulator [Elusimicrobiales bacterium]